jgi:O-antigen ligase
VTAPGRSADILRSCGAVAIALIAVTKCVLMFSAVIVFDVDPAMTPDRLAGLGPAGGLWLDIALLLTGAMTLYGEALAGRRLRWIALLFALIPMPIVLWHGAGELDDLWRGVGWCAAMLAAVTAMHLARDRTLRLLMLILMLGVFGPLLVRGAANVTFEHADAIAQFERNGEDFFRQKGWEPGSANALVYERRLRQNQPLAWFVTTNVFGSFMAFGMIAFSGFAAACVRKRTEGGWPLLFILIALACAIGLWMTDSLGALAVGAGGMVLLALVLLAHRLPTFIPRYFPLLAVLAVFAALGGIFVRGEILGEDFANERSLLFRWHYMEGAAGMVAERPMTGVGPDGFQDAYLVHRPDRSPEEVASSHNVFVDWVTMLGVSGFAWCLLLIGLVWRWGRLMRPPPLPSHKESRNSPHDSHPEAPPLKAAPALASMAAVVLLGLIPATLTELHTLDALGVFVRILGLLGYLGLAMFVGHVLVRLGEHLVLPALGAGVVALCVHGQVEMSFIQPNAVTWLLVTLGFVGFAPGSDPSSAKNARPRIFSGVLACALVAGVTLYIAIAFAIPVQRQEAMLLKAADTLLPLAEARGRGRVMSADDEIRIRTEAAHVLDDAAPIFPNFGLPVIAAATQYEKAAERAPDTTERIRLLRAAEQRYDIWLERGWLQRGAVRALFNQIQLAELTGDDAHLLNAVGIARALAERDPNGLIAWRRYADALWLAGQHDAARPAYRRVLEINANYELDPLRQLAEPVLDVIRDRLAQTETPGPEQDPSVAG